jgi:MFS family permease
MRLFRSRAFSSGVGACFLYSAGMYGVLFFLPQFLQTAQGYGPLGAGLRLLPWTAMLFVVAPVAGNLVNRIGERPLIVAGLILQAVGMSWIALIAAPDLAFSKLIAPLILSGAGVSMAMPAAPVAVFAATGGFGSATAFTAGFVAATGVSAILSLLGAVAGLWQPARLAVGTQSVSAKA